MLGTAVGLLAGYFGGRVDTVANWFVSVVVAFPFYVLIIALVFVLGIGHAEHLHRDHARRLGVLRPDRAR